MTDSDTRFFGRLFLSKKFAPDNSEEDAFAVAQSLALSRQLALFDEIPSPPFAVEIFC